MRFRRLQSLRRSGFNRAYFAKVIYLDTNGNRKVWRSRIYGTAKRARADSFEKFHAGHPQVMERKQYSIQLGWVDEGSF